MANWLDRMLGRSEAAPARLRGAPATPRMKNYAALSGYAYEYVFEGFRDQGGCREYVFRVSGDRKTWFYLPVRLSLPGLAAWEAGAGRTLRDNERYAMAKLALFAAFDERANPSAMQAPVEVDGAQAGPLLEQAGLD